MAAVEKAREWDGRVWGREDWWIRSPGDWGREGGGGNSTFIPPLPPPPPGTEREDRLDSSGGDAREREMESGFDVVERGREEGVCGTRA